MQLVEPKALNSTAAHQKQLRYEVAAQQSRAGQPAFDRCT
jgi:hypothetical protein